MKLVDVNGSNEARLPRSCAMAIRLVVLAFLFASYLHAEVLIPGVLEFEPPPFLESFKPSADNGSNPFAGNWAVPLREYLARGNSIPQMRQINVNLRTIGFTIGEGKRITYRSLTDKDVCDEMRLLMRSGRTTNISEIVETKLGGQPALLLKSTPAAADDQKNAATHFELFWVRYQTNQVIEVMLVAHSRTNLQSLDECLSRFKITKK